jgi:zinc-ribbon domain
MDIGVILLTFSILLLVALFITWPFFDTRKLESAPQAQELSALMAERDRTITALQELDFDYSLGKIPAEDYPQQRTELLRKGADVLRKIDALSPKLAAPDDAERRIEAAIAARRADASVQSSQGVDVDDEIESLISARRSGRKEKSGGFCPNCGRSILSSDRFCPNCGKVIK